MSYKTPVVVSSANNKTLEQAQQIESQNLQHQTWCRSNWYATDRGKHKVSKEDFQKKLNKLSRLK